MGLLMCSTSAERNLTKTNTGGLFLLVPDPSRLCMPLPWESLFQLLPPAQNQHIHHSTGSLPGLLTGGSNFVLESKLVLRFVSKARFEPSVSNTVRLEGTSGQKLFSCSSSVKTRCIIPARNMARRAVTRSQDLMLRPSARGAAWSGNTREEAQNAKEMT